MGVESPSPSYLLFSETRNAGYGIKEVLYHNSSCFTFGSMEWFLSRQGLVYDAKKERFIESCGQYGESLIQMYSLKQKKVFSRVHLPREVFGCSFINVSL